MMEDHLGVKRMMEDHLGEKCEMRIRIWNLHRVKRLTVIRIVLGQKGTIITTPMSSPVHHELGERHMRHGPKGTRAYARKPYCDAWVCGVAERPNPEDDREASDFDAPFPTGSRVQAIVPGSGDFPGPRASKEDGSTREGLGPIRMEDSVPMRKRGRPRKIPSIDAESLRSVTGVCRCGTLMQARQGPRSVREYTEEFLESTKRCKPKSAEDWCRWYKAGLREEIRGKLIGVLEPWEFALVNRMADQAMEAKRTLTRRVVAILSSEEDVEVEEDPSEDSEWEEEPAASTGSGRAAGPKPEGELKSPVRRYHGFWRYLETYLFDVYFVLPLIVFGNSPQFWDVKFELKIWNSGRIPNKRGRIVTPKTSPFKIFKCKWASTSFSLIRNLEAKPCREFPEIRSPSRRLLLSPPRRLSFLSLSSPRLSLLTLSSLRLLLSSLSMPPLSLIAVSSREWWCVTSRTVKLPGKGGINYPGRVERKKRGGRSVQKRRRCGAIASDKNGRVRIEAPIRLSHAESWREGVVIHCKGGPYPRNWATGLPGQATSQEAARKGEEWLHRLSVVTRRFSFRIEPTISGNVNGKKGNAPGTHGTSNGTHGDVRKVDMCVLNPAPRNPGRKWEGAGSLAATAEQGYYLV
ncbi:hypothetical protein IGI04_013799 [Brassica rapa subsp. trilocularis]|uniref:Retrotransposon gag domain-containing protein n=1 Tax=Brassica rapa subsp. trilocularis TaxID=1813537 RepID=A0ABQ7NC97_BRACM|nr:hypothetical protein IGI04_013799 [Brassica rapa subsp. trilocularis]